MGSFRHLRASDRWPIPALCRVFRRKTRVLRLFVWLRLASFHTLLHGSLHLNPLGSESARTALRRLDPKTTITSASKNVGRIVPAWVTGHAKLAQTATGV
jgi:hypothetical protein